MVYKCLNCGANAIFDPDKGKMYCPHCDGIDSEQLQPGAGLNSCVVCGAPVEPDQYTSATKCEHCGSYMIFEERITGEREPHLILPFKVSKQKAKDCLKEKFGKKLFIPDGFLKEASLDKMEGIYVPFFMYDYDCTYEYSGTGKKVRRWRSGNTEYTETSTFQVERVMDVPFDKIPVDASIKMEDGTMDLLEPYDYSALEVFQTKYMSGFLGEMKNMEPSEVENRARHKAKADAESLMRGTMTEYEAVTPTRQNLNLIGKRTQYALLPVWDYTFRYKGKDYHFKLNGQTGKLIGATPISWGKAIGYTATMFFGLYAVLGLLLNILGGL